MILIGNNVAENGKEVENRLDDFWKTQLNKERSKGKISKILQVALDEKKRIIIKENIVYSKNK